MNDPTNPEQTTLSPSAVSRRNVLGATAALAAAPLLASRARAEGPLFPPGRTTERRAEVRSRARPRYLHAAVGTPDGRVVVIGGYGVGEATRSRVASAPLASVQAYDPRTAAWTDLAPLAQPRARHAAVLLPDGRIAVLGGLYAAPLATVEVYDPRANAWSAAEPLPIALFDHIACACAGGILVTGGQAGRPALLVPFPA